VLITNRKSLMGFRLVTKLLTFNDLERCNGHYFALFFRYRCNKFCASLLVWNSVMSLYFTSVTTWEPPGKAAGK